MRFTDFHPLNLIVFFSSVIIFTMLTMNPVLLALSFICAFFSVLKVNRKTDAILYFLLFFIIAITNPLFSHNGETVLFYLFEQRITLEAFLYGISAAIRIVSVIYWFKLFSKVFTQDKLNWFLGKLSPKISVIFSMALRFIPLVKNNAKDIYNAQISIGVFDTDKLTGKFNLLGNVFSALISMSIENAIETADTMRSRGFGNKGRTSFSLFKLKRRDVFIILEIILLDTFIAFLLFNGVGVFYYYPAISFSSNVSTYILYICFILLCMIPLINDFLEDLRWKYLISKI